MPRRTEVVGSHGGQVRGTRYEEYKQNCRKKAVNILHNQNNDSERWGEDSV